MSIFKAAKIAYQLPLTLLKLPPQETSKNWSLDERKEYNNEMDTLINTSDADAWLNNLFSTKGLPLTNSTGPR